MARTPKKPVKAAEPAAVEEKLAAKKKARARLPKPSDVPAKKAAKKKAEPKKRVPKEPKAHATRGKGEEEIKIIERRYKVWDLYKAGVSIRAIAEHLKAQGEKNASPATVHADLKYCLDLQHDDLALDVQNHIENEVAIVNDVQLTFYPVMKDKKMPLDVRMDAGDRVINCVKERAKLRNLYKPVKVNFNVDEELAKLLGISPDQLPDVDQPEPQ